MFAENFCGQAGTCGEVTGLNFLEKCIFYWAEGCLVEVVDNISFGYHVLDVVDRWLRYLFHCFGCWCCTFVGSVAIGAEFYHP